MKLVLLLLLAIVVVAAGRHAMRASRMRYVEGAATPTAQEAKKALLNMAAQLRMRTPPSRRHRSVSTTPRAITDELGGRPITSVEEVHVDSQEFPL